MDSLQKMSHVEIRGAMTYLSTQITKTTDEAEKKALNEQFQKVFALYTEKLESAPKDSSYATTITTDYQTRHLTTLLSDVPKFNGAGPLALINFITQVDQIYDNNVKENPQLEAAFLKVVRNRLDADVYNVLKNSGKDLSTYPELKEWLETQYNTKVTNFQLLGQVFDFTFGSDENYVQKAQRLENLIRATGSHIKSQYKKKHNKEISVDEVLGLVGAQIITEHVRKTDAKIIGHMALQMEDFVTASDVARHAEQIVNRAGETPLSEKTTFYGNSKGFKGKGKSSRFNRDDRDRRDHYDDRDRRDRYNNRDRRDRYDDRDRRDRYDNRDRRDRYDNRDRRDRDRDSRDRYNRDNNRDRQKDRKSRDGNEKSNSEPKVHFADPQRSRSPEFDEDGYWVKPEGWTQPSLRDVMTDRDPRGYATFTIESPPRHSPVTIPSDPDSSPSVHYDGVNLFR